MNRLHTLSNNSFVKVAGKVFARIDYTMSGPHMGYQPWGWDWPTFGVLYPRKREVWRKFQAEAIRRNVTTFPDMRLNLRKDGRNRKVA